MRPESNLDDTVQVTNHTSEPGSSPSILCPSPDVFLFSSTGVECGGMGCQTESGGGDGERRALLKMDAEARCPRPSKYGTAEVGDLYDERTFEGCNERKGKDAPRTPLPVKQLSVLLAMRTAEPLAYSQVLPYVNSMIMYLGVVSQPAQAGYFSGFLSSAFAIAELATVMGWGRLAKSIGRKRVLVLGLIGTAISTLIFGLSRSYAMSLIMRGVAGGLSAYYPVLQAVIGDITDETNETVAYGLLAGVNNLAELVGPFIGGTFAEPEITFPKTFGSIALFRHFPFLLPCLFCVVFTIIVAAIGALKLQEPARRSSGTRHNDADRKGVLRIATFPPLRAILLNYFMLTVLDCGLYVVFALFAYAPVSSGGLSRNPTEIGYAFVFCGCLGAICQIVILPILRKRFGTLSLFKYLIRLLPIGYAMFPIVNLIARATIVDANGVEGEGYTNPPAGPLVWASAAFIILLDRLACLGFPLCLLMIRSAVPSSSAVDTAFGLLHLMNCVGRALAPSLTSSLFSLSASTGWLGGNLVWVVMVSLSLLAVWATSSLKDDVPLE